MPERIPQSVVIRVAFNAFLTGTVTPATGKTIPITISKNCAAFGNPSAGATNATEVSNGLYYVDLSTTDTATAGPLEVLGIEGTIDNVNAHYRVVSAHNAGFDGVSNVTAGGTNGLLINGTNTGTVTLAALAVSGATTFTGAVALGSTLGVTGATTLAGLSTAALSCTTLTATGAVSFQSTFSTTGTTTFNALTITNATTLTGIVTATNASNDIRGVQVGGFSSAGVTATVAAVWDSTISGHTTSGTFGGALNSASSAGDPWQTPLPGAYGAGTAGHIVGTAIPDVAPGSNGGLLRGGTNTATTFATLTSTAAFTVGSIVNNGVTDVAQTGNTFAALTVTSYAEPTGAPTASATLPIKLGFLYEVLRNKITVTATDKSFYNDAGALQWSKSLTDDGITYTEAEGS